MNTHGESINTHRKRVKNEGEALWKSLKRHQIALKKHHQTLNNRKTKQKTKKH